MLLIYLSICYLLINTKGKDFFTFINAIQTNKYTSF